MDFITFGSVAFAICSFVYVFLIIITYVRKQLITGEKNNIYMVLLFLVLALAVIEIIATIGVAHGRVGTFWGDTWCRIYLGGACLWCCILVYYIVCLFNMRLPEERLNKIKLIAFLFLNMLTPPF